MAKLQFQPCVVAIVNSVYVSTYLYKEAGDFNMIVKIVIKNINNTYRVFSSHITFPLLKMMFIELGEVFLYNK